MLQKYFLGPPESEMFIAIKSLLGLGAADITIITFFSDSNNNNNTCYESF
jgi:hypothetical protein